MENTSPTIKVNISQTLGVKENILLGEICSLKEFSSYKYAFQKLRDIFAWSYFNILGIKSTIFEHHINTYMAKFLS